MVFTTITAAATVAEKLVKLMKKNCNIVVYTFLWCKFCKKFKVF